MDPTPFYIAIAMGMVVMVAALWLIFRAPSKEEAPGAGLRVVPGAPAGRSSRVPGSQPPFQRSTPRVVAPCSGSPAPSYHCRGTNLPFVSFCRGTVRAN
jgi:hypothetical protein